jgi:hypothetical protein
MTYNPALICQREKWEIKTPHPNLKIQKGPQDDQWQNGQGREQRIVKSIFFTLSVSYHPIT